MIYILNKVVNKKLVSILFIFIVILSFRSFTNPLFGDENTYFKIATNIIKGKYYQNNFPSTVVPSIPFLMAIFYIPKIPMLGFIFQKIFHISLTILGFRFANQSLKKLNLNVKIRYILLLLTSLSSGFINFSSSYWHIG